MDDKLPAWRWVLQPQTQEVKGLSSRTLPLVCELHAHGAGLEGAITFNRFFREKMK